MTDLDLCFRSAFELASDIRTKTVSPVEVIENALARIDQVNPKVNGFCFVYADEAMDKARLAEADIQAGKDVGPLHGVPFAIKDFTPTAGKRTTLGSKIFEHWVPDQDPPLVERLLNAGGIMIGKTTTPEFAHSSFTDSPLWGPTRNPWNLDCTAGGSSGGSAVAVATGCVPIAEGSDAGGSIRIPAALSGIVGLKPSFGRIPMGILPTAFDSIFHFGPLSRTVADSALFLNLTQGPDDRDIMSLPATAPIPVPVARQVAGLRLALCPDQGFFALDPDVEANTHASAEALREAGAVVEEIQLGWTRQIVDDWFQHWAVFFAAYFEQHLDEWQDQMTPEVVQIIHSGQAVKATDFKRLEAARTKQWETLRPILSKFDALLTATMALPAPLVGGKDSDYDSNDDAGRYQGLDMTCTLNFVSQCPAVSVPSGFTAGGLPTGLQIVGRRYDEATVLRVAGALEVAQSWAGLRPPI
jgi:Asp-tRNA(Asn)/Glu-tRNA(Gln) amidotransferase A subunit family amidase|tara:strand:+ start:21734 stop:23146 length:1413 start_codon:yes stop_codon:yes gene_type:complete